MILSRLLSSNVFLEALIVKMMLLQIRTRLKCARRSRSTLSKHIAWLYQLAVTNIFTYLVWVNPCCVRTKTKRIVKNAEHNFMMNAEKTFVACDSRWIKFLLVLCSLYTRWFTNYNKCKQTLLLNTRTKDIGVFRIVAHARRGVIFLAYIRGETFLWNKARIIYFLNVFLNGTCSKQWTLQSRLQSQQNSYTT